MIKTLQILLLTMFLASCGEIQQEFMHTYDSIKGIENAQLIYAPTGADYTDDNNSETYKSPLKEENQVTSKVSDVPYSIIIVDEIGVTSFDDIPSKYINLDARVAVS